MANGENKLVGIDKNFIFDALIGLGAAIIFITLSFINPIFGVIGIPSVAASVAGNIGRFLIIVILAPIFEEIFFRDITLDLFDSKFKMPFFIAAILSAVLFSLFHFAAYGESLSALSGSFISAGLVGFSFAYVRKYTDSLMAVIVAHAALNYWILSKVALVIV